MRWSRWVSCYMPSGICALSIAGCEAPSGLTPDDDGPASIAKEREYHELFRDHGWSRAHDAVLDAIEVRCHASS